jgi:uncharacterized protein YjbI with pentapeptide repeats
MADSQQVERLRSDIASWNHWRQVNPFMAVDLSRADLRGLDLSRANLSGADLYKAGLFQANVSGADLRDADLSSTNLCRANFSGADLSGANLSFADLGETLFINTNLSRATGLDRCSHCGPSTIDPRTLAKSGNLPTTFLRGCGLPDRYIETDSVRPSLFASCFISYSTKDQEFADRLHADLQNNGVRCWFAPEDLKIGDPFQQRIDESIRLHDKLFLILSEHSVNSPWVQDEVEAALERERQEGRSVLFPIRIDDAVMETAKAWAASIRRTRHIGDFSTWKDQDSYQQAFQRLLRDLKAERKAEQKR